MTYKFIRQSQNRKTGPIPVTYSSRATCPASCVHYRSTCYAEGGPTRLAWNRAENGIGIAELCAHIQTIPRGRLWRYGVAGDLPGDGEQLDREGLAMLVRANMPWHALVLWKTLFHLRWLHPSAVSGF